MPVMPPSQLLGLLVTGDLAEMTYVQTSLHRRTVFAKTYPKTPRTGAQKLFSSRFAAAVAEWKTLSPTSRQTLDAICVHHGMVMSGYNLYISCKLHHRLDWITGWAAEQGLPW